MSESVANSANAIRKEHPLWSFAKNYAVPPVADPGVTIRIVPFLYHYNVRGNPAADGFLSAAYEALGQELPLDTNTVSRGPHRVYWLGPTEWLVVVEPKYPELGQLLTNTLRGHNAAVTNLSGGQLMLELSGPHVRDLLAKGSTIDFHERAFGVGDCAQSVMAKASALFALAHKEPVFELVVRRSFADYLALWLDRAGREFDTVFKTD